MKGLSTLASALEGESSESKKAFQEYLGVVKNKFSALSFLIQKYKKKVETLQEKLDHSLNDYDGLAKSHQYLVQKLHTQLRKTRAESRRAHSLMVTEQRKNREIKREIEISHRSNQKGRNRPSFLFESNFEEVAFSREVPQTVDNFMSLIGVEAKKGKKENGGSNLLRIKWSQVDESIKELLLKTVNYLIEELEKEKQNRLKAEEQSAQIIEELHQNNRNLEERIKQLSKQRSSHSLTQLLRQHSNQSMLSSPVRGRNQILQYSQSLQINTSFQKSAKMSDSPSVPFKNSEILKNSSYLFGSGVTFQKVTEYNSPCSQVEKAEAKQPRRGESKVRSFRARTVEFTDED